MRLAHGLIARLRVEDEAAAIRPWADVEADLHHPNLSDRLLQHVGARCSRWPSWGGSANGAIPNWKPGWSAWARCRPPASESKARPCPSPALLLHRTIYLFCILLPFAMAEPLGWLTPVFTAIVSYTFFSLDEIGDDLEDPFGFDERPAVQCPATPDRTRSPGRPGPRRTAPGPGAGRLRFKLATGLTQGLR